MGLMNQPEFEQEDDATTTDAASSPNNTSASENTSVAPAQSTAVGKALKFGLAFSDAKDAFPVEAVQALSMASPRIKGEQGGCYVGNDSLGSKIRMTVESWNNRWLISAGLTSSDAGYKESMEYLKTSYDGRTIYGDGRTIEQYIEFLRAEGFEKAKSSPYSDIWGFVTWTEKNGEIAEEDRTLHLLQASQTSQGAFMAFCTTQGLLRSKGIGKDFNEIEVRAMARSKGTLKYTNFDFAVPK